MTDKFDNALADYLKNREHLDSLAESTDLEDERSASDAYSYSHDRVCVAPASNLVQLRAKAEIIWGDEASTPTKEARLSFLKDLQAMTDRTPSLILNVRNWLAWFERRGGGWIDREGEIVLLVPDDGRADDALFELEAHGARDQVFALIRELNPAREAA